MPTIVTKTRSLLKENPFVLFLIVFTPFFFNTTISSNKGKEVCLSYFYCPVTVLMSKILARDSNPPDTVNVGIPK
ncbi:MAG: hypothetical protein ACI8R6_000101 [Candidatus Paceibacteria bacterium]|jgi:hypothetical protein